MRSLVMMRTVSDLAGAERVSDRDLVLRPSATSFFSAACWSKVLNRRIYLYLEDDFAMALHYTYIYLFRSPEEGLVYVRGVGSCAIAARESAAARQLRRWGCPTLMLQRQRNTIAFCSPYNVDYVGGFKRHLPFEALVTKTHETSVINHLKMS